MHSPLGGPTNPEYWDTIFDLVPFPVYVVDIATYEVININRAMRVRIGATNGRPCYQAIYQKDAPCLNCKIPVLLGAPRKPGDELISELFNDVDDRWYQTQESIITWFDGRAAKYTIAVDISSMKQAQNELAAAHARLAIQNQELEKFAITDVLSGMFNRRKLIECFEDEGKRLNRYGDAISVVIADVDHFKMVNDSFGHLIGDKVLAGIARVLQHHVRTVDICGRWGGEEFLIICPKTDAAGAANVAEHLRGLIEAHDFPSVGRVTCSFGVAQMALGEDRESVVARADAALYKAKRQGRNRVEVAAEE